MLMTVPSSRLRAAWGKVHSETGFRSGYEVEVAKHLPSSALYEPHRLPYSITQVASYLPDWVLPEQAIVLEAKGRFTLEDRKKMLAVRNQYPDLDIRLLFQRSSQKVTKALTAEAWCKKNGFLCAQGPEIPLEWLKHKPSKKSRAAFDSHFHTQ
jgi:hypothetical protein